MRYERIILPALILLAAACGSSTATSSSTSGAGTTGDCFDYGSFTATTPTVSLKTDVLPIFSRSCALSSACHSCDNMSTPGCTTPGYQPFLGVATGGAAATTAQVAAIISTTVGKPATAQASTADGKMVGNPTMSIITASDPSKSFLTYKLDGEFSGTPTDNDVTCSTLACASTKSCGESMPLGGTGLDESDKDTIRRWIAQGAQNN